MAIPFVINKYTNLDKNSVEQEFGSILQTDMPTYFINNVAKYIFEMSGVTVTPQIVNSYMNKKNFWNGFVFVENRWETVQLNYDAIFSRIKQLQIWEYEDIELDCGRHPNLCEA